MTDFDTTNEGAPTAPLPIAGSTAPQPPSGPAFSASVPAGPSAAAGRPRHLSTGGIVAIALAGALAIGAVSFGAGWGAHGLVDGFDGRRGVMMGAQGAPGAYGNGYGRGYGEQDPNGYGGRGWSDGDSANGYGGRGMDPRNGYGGQPVPDGGQGQNQYWPDENRDGVSCPVW